MPEMLSLPPRKTLRASLLAQREAFLKGSSGESAAHALAAHLKRVLADLEPRWLGLYWPIRSEFNAPSALAADAGHSSWPLALTYCRKAPIELQYRAWDGREPQSRDECNMLTADGAVVVPDVVLVPCAGFTRAGFRLGYGGGYFDRWMAAHPHATAVGVAWAVGELTDADFQPEPHDLPLALIVTENGVV